ncbi:MerR family transcriptional regulator [Isoptericola sp. b408]|uniref:MerR family transcriptional regulator n=1 Tax=Isoptericola sp. b408 TaxID=3064653 RepID=UPI0027129427|nr:MerR family transcriptional regulator [Isoptericola sp. b408]MDO8151110.1 MerR family transcriptional regulator [Isoptericola sp. b408]
MSEHSTRMPIGEFGRVTWLSPRALRLYERRGLLTPEVVDQFTGYRYYGIAQADRARLIALLRRAGMPLDRIGDVLDADPRRRSDLVAAYREDAARQHARTVALLDDLIDDLDGDRSHPTRSHPPVERRDVPAQVFLSRTVRTTAADLPRHVEVAATELSRRAGSSRDEDRPLVVVYHGEVSWESDGPIDVRVPVHPDSGVDGTEVEPAGSEMFVAVPYGAVQFPTILGAFDAVRAAATVQDRRPLGPPREIYRQGDPFRCEVSQPYAVTRVGAADGYARPVRSRTPRR